MEKNTVCIDLDTYNEWRDADIRLKKGEVAITLLYGLTQEVMRFYPADEALRRAEAVNAQLTPQIKELKSQLSKAKSECDEMRKKADDGAYECRGRIINEFRGMTLWQFYKWKHGNYKDNL